MSIALIMPGRDTSGLEADLAHYLPEVPVQVWPELADPDSVVLAVVWKQPPHALENLPNLRAVTSYGAGVDFIVDDDTIPPGLPVARLVDPALAEQVTGYLLAVVLERVRELGRYRQAQRAGQWQPAGEPAVARIGLLGLGQLGSHAADSFRHLGFPVRGWQRRDGDRSRLLEIAADSDFLICTLPLTTATRGILDAAVFEAMPASGTVINVGRGAHVVEADLLAALDTGQIAAAVLDVFEHEPLPADHRYWHHPRVTVTPHVAGLTDPHSAAALVAESYRAVAAGEPPPHPVDRGRGY